MVPLPKPVGEVESPAGKLEAPLQTEANNPQKTEDKDRSQGPVEGEKKRI